MKIVLAERDDVPAINDIHNHYIRTTTANWSWEERQLEEAYAWFDAHDPQGYYPVYVMRQEGRTIGYASLSPFRNKASYWPVAENSVYVHPDHNGKGVGAALLQRLIDHASSAGLRVITAWIDSSNNSSIAFHERFGFAICGEMKDVGDKWDQRLSVTIMQLHLKNSDDK